jgi:hypothetical protein
MADPVDLRRRPVVQVVDGLAATSDKIRALALAGYLRTEIRDLLQIRYQHVRKVLEDAGIKEGLQRGVPLERPPLPMDRASVPRLPTAANDLLRAGFQLVGKWGRGDGGRLVLIGDVPVAP